MRTRSTLLLAALAAAPALAGAQTNVADYNVNPLARAFASDSGAFGTRPSNVIDGNTRSNYFDVSGLPPGSPNNVYHSGGSGAFFYVDLGSAFSLSRLVFYNRSDNPSGTEAGRAAGVRLSLFTDLPAFAPGGTGVATFSTLLTADLIQSFDFAPQTARFVGVQGRNDTFLNFGEIQAFTVRPTAVVPEPSTWVLLGGGLVTLGAAAARRRTTA